MIGWVLSLLPFLLADHWGGVTGLACCWRLLDSKFLRSGEGGERPIPFPFGTPDLSALVVAPPLLAPSFPLVFLDGFKPLLLSAAEGAEAGVAVGMVILMSDRRR